MKGAHRSGCPINLTLEMLGDRWSLIVIRDIMFGNRRHYRELLNNSEEGIASLGSWGRRHTPASKELSIRRVWLFAQTQQGARASANLYSLVSCARVNGFEPYAYLYYLFEELPKATTAEALGDEHLQVD